MRHQRVHPAEGTKRRGSILSGARFFRPTDAGRLIVSAGRGKRGCRSKSGNWCLCCCSCRGTRAGPRQGVWLEPRAHETCCRLLHLLRRFALRSAIDSDVEKKLLAAASASASTSTSPSPSPSSSRPPLQPTPVSRVLLRLAACRLGTSAVSIGGGCGSGSIGSIGGKKSGGQNVASSALFRRRHWR